MSIKDFFMKNKTPKFEEVATNKNNPMEEISRTSNPEAYRAFLTSLASSFFVFQANCARIKTYSDTLSANVLYNAYNSYGAPSTMPTMMGAVTFTQYCNAVKQNPNLDCTLDKSHNGNIFAHNLLAKNQAINQTDLNRDISVINSVLNATLATYGGRHDVDIPQNEDSSGILNFANFQVIYANSPKYAFDNDSFDYPNGVNPPLAHNDIAQYSEQEVFDSLTILKEAEKDLIETVEQVNNFSQDVEQ